MKIRFLKTIGVDVESRQGEVFAKTFHRWDTLSVSIIHDDRFGFATIQTEQDDFLHGVPLASFEKLDEVKRTVSL
jgi:hypothetical protein